MTVDPSPGEVREMTSDEHPAEHPAEDAAEQEEPAADAAEQEEPAENAAEQAHPAASRRGFGAVLRARWRSITIAALLTASIALAATLYFGQYRPDAGIGEASRTAVVDAASAGTVALLSYAPDTLEGNLAEARSQLTGGFLDYYTSFTDDVVAPAVKDRGISAQASVVRAGVIELQPDAAKVLVFLNQTTSSQDRPEPAMTASSVIVTLTKVDGTWMISAFDPV